MAEVLIAEVHSDCHPWAGHRDRSSENFSLSAIPHGARELLWRIESDSGDIRFSVMSDVRANYDQRVLSNIASGSRTPVPRERESLTRRGFYIAAPSGAAANGFVVKVYAEVP